MAFYLFYCTNTFALETQVRRSRHGERLLLRILGIVSSLHSGQLVLEDCILDTRKGNLEDRRRLSALLAGGILFNVFSLDNSKFRETARQGENYIYRIRALPF